MHMRKMAAILIAAVCLNSAAITAFADDTDGNEFVVEGNCTDQFTLTCNDVLFSDENINPGDVWESEIFMKNSGTREMNITLKEIISNIKDKRLFEQMQLELSREDDVIYEGSYGKTKSPVMEPVTIQGGEEVVLGVSISLPPETANEFQGLPADTTWVFEANYEEPASLIPDGPKDIVDTGIAVLTSNTFSLSSLSIGAIIASIGYLIHRKKKNQE